MSSFGIPVEHSFKRPKIAIIGGSGMCTLPEIDKELYRVRPMTKYGLPSDEIRVCEYSGIIIAFLPRHGSNHTIAPHRVPYKANLLALQELGVHTIFATCIVGSLKSSITPGSLVVPNQFVNMTWGRDDYVEKDNGKFLHLPMADPYCETTRQKIIQATEDCGHKVLKKGVVAVIQGPRFSTRAESLFFMHNGWDIVNMTQYPECYLARELGLCYGVLASVTDYDVGIESQLAMQSSNMKDVLKIFNRNIQNTKNVIFKFLDSYNTDMYCNCSKLEVHTYFEQK